MPRVGPIPLLTPAEVSRYVTEQTALRALLQALPGRWSARDEEPVGSAEANTIVLGPTLMPGWMMPRFYRPLATRFGGGGEVAFHPMPERGGLGRTDVVVDHFRPLVASARLRGVTLRIAGHSLGGLVAWALAHEYPETIEAVELWGAPINGTLLGHTRGPVAEMRFLARESRWLHQYAEPVDDVFVRAVVTPLDVLAMPGLIACRVPGENAETHIVSPVPIPRLLRPRNSWVHIAAAGHTLLPKRQDVQDHLAAHDARIGRVWHALQPVAATG